MKISLVFLMASAGLVTGCATGVIVTSEGIAPTATYQAAGTINYALPRVKTKLQLKKKGAAYSLAFAGDVAGPDPNNMFAIKYDASLFSDDSVKIVTTSDGLLSTIDITNEDKRGAFLIQLVELAKQSAKVVGAFDVNKETQAETEVTVADLLVDLTDNAELKDLNDFLAGKTTGIAVSVAGVGPPKQDAVTGSQDAQTASDKSKEQPPKFDAAMKRTATSTLKEPVVTRVNCSASICFRPTLGYLVTIDNAKQGTRTQQMIHSPNRAPILSLDITRASFVKKVTNIAFDKGMITSVTIAKPSEALAFISIPIEILKAIVAIPSELVQFKIDMTNKDKGLAEAQKQLIDVQLQLIDARKRLGNQAVD